MNWRTATLIVRASYINHQNTLHTRNQLIQNKGVVVFFAFICFRQFTFHSSPLFRLTFINMTVSFLPDLPLVCLQTAQSSSTIDAFSGRNTVIGMFRSIYFVSHIVIVASLLFSHFACVLPQIFGLPNAHDAQMHLTSSTDTHRIRNMRMFNLFPFVVINWMELEKYLSNRKT